MMLFVFLLSFFACDTDEMEGVCIYNDSVCTDERSKLGCNNKKGDFTHGNIGDASEICPDKGFGYLCGDGKEEFSTIWVISEDDCNSVQ